MRIAILNSFPNLHYSAEREFIVRLKLVCLKLGWVCIETVTSEDILDANVDCVLVTHECSPKLTSIPTIGLLWNPPDFFRDDPIRIRNILSYDGYLSGSDSIRQYLGDLLFSTRKNSPISDWNFLPSAPGNELRLPDLKNPSLFYAGVHWDGKRHEKLIKGLVACLPMAFYGNPEKWRRYKTAYKGTIPFDGTSVFSRINEAGVALCLHRTEHLKHDVPSMRIFEAAAASAVIITENSNFAKRYFGDSVLYVDQEASVKEKIHQVSTHFKWISSHPDEALVMATQSNKIFNEHFSLEKLLAKLPEFLLQVRRANHYEIDTRDNINPMVEAIVRMGGRDIVFVKRCLDSLAAQSHVNLGLILVSYRKVPGLESLLEKYRTRFTSIKQIPSIPTGFRSTSLWDGMRAVEAEYFCNLDDDDTIHPNHVRSLVILLESEKNYQVAYSGCIQVQDEPGHYYSQPNFNGPINAQIRESRHFLFFDTFHRQRLLRADNFLVSNAWLARKSILHERDMADPMLAVVEDMYLLRLFLRHGDFLFSWIASANWHLRSISGDNSVMQETSWEQCAERVRLRTQYFGLENGGNDTLSRKVRWLLVKSYAQETFPYIYSLLKSFRKWANR